MGKFVRYTLSNYPNKFIASSLEVGYLFVTHVQIITLIFLLPVSWDMEPF